MTGHIIARPARVSGANPTAPGGWPASSGVSASSPAQPSKLRPSRCRPLGAHWSRSTGGPSLSRSESARPRRIPGFVRRSPCGGSPGAPNRKNGRFFIAHEKSWPSPPPPPSFFWRMAGSRPPAIRSYHVRQRGPDVAGTKPTPLSVQRLTAPHSRLEGLFGSRSEAPPDSDDVEFTARWARAGANPKNPWETR